MIKPKNYYGHIYDLDADDVRLCTYTKQLEDDGFDDTETWSLYSTIAKFTLPRLKRFKEITSGYPSNLTEKQWDEYVEKIIAAFELLVKEDDIPIFSDEEDLVVQEGLDLFAKYFRSLWW